MDVKGNLKISGKVYLNDTNTTLMEGSNNVLRIQSDHGYLDVGPKNTSWCHFYTDRPWYYFNAGIMVDGGKLRSYNEDLSIAANWTNNNNLTQLHLKTGGNVGIGTTNPSELFHVAGIARVDDYIRFPYVNHTNFPSTLIPNVSTLKRAIWMDMEGDESFLEYGHLDAGQTYTQFRVTDNNTGDRFRIYIDDWQGESKDRIPLDVRGDRVLLSQDGGLVGIGTTNPTTKLDVMGDITFGVSSNWQIDEGSWTAGDAHQANIRYQGSQTTSTFGIHGIGNNKSVNVFIDGGVQAGNNHAADDSYIENGNFGIGTITPSAKLDVAGQVKITGGNPGANKILTSDATGLATWETVSAVGLVGPKGDKGDTGDAGPSTDTYVNDLTFTNNQLTITRNDSWSKTVDLSGLDDSALMGGTDNDWNVSNNNMNTIPTGNVGIGVGSPTAKLHISNPAASTVAFKLGRVSGQPSIKSTDGWLIMDNKDNGTACALNYYVNDKVILAYGGGDVGVGLINPLAKLHVYTTDASVVLNGETLYGTFTYGGSAGVGNKTNNVVLKNKTGGGNNTSSSWQTRTSDDDIAIEVTTYFTNDGADISYNALAMNSGAGTVNILGATNDADTAVLSLQSDSKITFQSHSISWPSATKETMTIDITNDRVGVNSATPDVDFHVEGQVKIEDGTQGDGKVLTSNATGVASWKEIPASSGGGGGGTGSGFAMPIGSIIEYAGQFAPAGWHLCDGDLYYKDEYPELFDVIGTFYNVGDEGTGTGNDTRFRLPNLKGRVPIGHDGNNPRCNTMGGKDGYETITLTDEQIPHKPHKHSIDHTRNGQPDKSSEHFHVISWVHDNSGSGWGSTSNQTDDKAASVINLHSSKKLNCPISELTAWGHLWNTTVANTGSNTYQIGAGSSWEVAQNSNAANCVLTGKHTYTPSSNPEEKSSYEAMKSGNLLPDGAHGHSADAMSTGTASSHSGGGEHDNMQPYLTLNFIIYTGTKYDHAVSSGGGGSN